MEKGVQQIINAPTMILTVLAAFLSDTNLGKMKTKYEAKNISEIQKL